MTEPPEYEPEHSHENALVINNTREPRYWREIETGTRSGEWTATGQSGPNVGVTVTPKGIEVVLPGAGRAVVLRPGAARWTALRLAEAVGVYESVFGGDGTSAPGKTRPALVHAGGSSATAPAAPRRLWLCGCGRSSPNRGAMVSHATKCDKGPAVPVVEEG